MTTTKKATTEQVLNTIRRLQVETAKEAKASSDQDTELCLLDLAHDLAGCYRDVQRQDWRGVLDTIDAAERALAGDWTWRA